MNKASTSSQDYLSHDLTPQALAKINLAICQVLSYADIHVANSGSESSNKSTAVATVTNTDEVNIDDSKLRALVEQRDEFIQQHLSSLGADDKNAFAKAELPINNQLQATVKNLFTDSLSELSTLVRGLKAIKKYK